MVMTADVDLCLCSCFHLSLGGKGNTFNAASQQNAPQPMSKLSGLFEEPLHIWKNMVHCTLLSVVYTVSIRHIGGQHLVFCISYY